MTIYYVNLKKNVNKWEGSEIRKHCCMSLKSRFI